MAYKGKTLIGIVGYTPVVETFPLGPRLMSALTDRFGAASDVVVENMSWGPMHIVQRFQEEQTECPDRLVLIGAASVCRSPGRVGVARWVGGKLPDGEVQERIYEAVTGIVDIENTLIIGEHFGVWPNECFTVEVDLQADAFGTMVVAESGQLDQRFDLEEQLGFSPVAVTREIASAAITIAVHGPDSNLAIKEKSATGLAPFERFTFNHVVSDREQPIAGSKEMKP